MQYAVFGGCLRADIDFPELRPAPDREPDWVLTRMSSGPGPSPVEPLGEVIEGPLHVCAFRTVDGFRLAYDDTGVFDITESGSRITWYPRPGADVDSARLDIIGRVLSVAAHATGVLALHGSAVAINGDGIAILAQKNQGKTTLALSLTLAGAQLLTDDTIPVEHSLPPFIRPGIHSVRLRDDSAARMPGIAGHAWRQNAKLTFNALETERLMEHAVPLTTIYVLESVQGDRDGPAVTRERLQDIRALLAVVTHTKLGALLGGTEGALIFDRAVNLVQSIPVYALSVTRNFDRVDEVVAQMMEWHRERSDEPEGESGP